ncbi:uncharacterized protein HMPREF1541_09584 [Cyphellophora europaea CBS 101466]|uniref:Uncharacterized protein n=1 Tax=Cyphellophora europaea (strain CBS 101466) TaxID=1220924 RepID=W2SAJ4_CYPE1|nr:uncharacterized protein HMPREF1541_09584 [Cyphellophora europaea CBS 101466]ETN45751.1 hypothetical protein HMPREF1541_09584 [Cyphellophora europaea CBS 101466]
MLFSANSVLRVSGSLSFMKYQSDGGEDAQRIPNKRKRDDCDSNDESHVTTSKAVCLSHPSTGPAPPTPTLLSLPLELRDRIYAHTEGRLVKLQLLSTRYAKEVGYTIRFRTPGIGFSGLHGVNRQFRKELEEWFGTNHKIDLKIHKRIILGHEIAKFSPEECSRIVYLRIFPLPWESYDLWNQPAGAIITTIMGCSAAALADTLPSLDGIEFTFECARNKRDEVNRDLDDFCEKFAAIRRDMDIESRSWSNGRYVVKMAILEEL